MPTTLDEAIAKAKAHAQTVAKASGKVNRAALEARIKPRILHPGQQDVEECDARFIVLACGRRWGKSVFLANRAARRAVAGQRYGWFAPNYKYMEDAWREVESILYPIKTQSNKTERRIEVEGGGSVEFWTLEDENAGRSRFYHEVGIDEAGMVSTLETTWMESIRATLTDYQGSAIFAGTPKGTNFFAKAFKMGLSDEFPDWKSFQKPTSSNPHLPPEEILDAKSQMPLRAFRQEYLAEFLEEAEGALWRREWFDSFRVPDIPENVVLEHVVVAADPATTSNPDSDLHGCVVAGVGSDARYYVLNDLSASLTPSEYAKLLVKAWMHYRADCIVIETNQGGDWLASLIRTVSTQVPIRMVHAKKGKHVRAEPVAALYEMGMVSHVDGKTLHLSKMEDEMATWDPQDLKMESPNRLDACVYAIAQLSGKLGTVGRVTTYTKEA